MAKRKRRWFRRLTLALLLAGLGAVGGFWYLTNPARLRSEVLRALTGSPLADVELGRVAFSLRDGLHIDSLVAWMPRADAAQPRGPLPVLRVEDLQLRCDLWSLATREPRFTGLNIHSAQLNVPLEPPAEREPGLPDEFDAGARRVWHFLKKAQHRLPPVSLDRIDLRVVELTDGGQPRFLERLNLAAIGQLAATGYELRVKRIPATGVEVAHLRWDDAASEVVAGLDWMDLDVLARLLPPGVNRRITDLGLSGRIRTEQMRLRLETPADDPQATERARLRLAAITLGLEDLHAASNLGVGKRADSAPYLTLAEGAARLRYARDIHAPLGELHTQLTGKIHDATLNVTAATRLADLMELGETPESRKPGVRGVTWNDVEEAEIQIRGLTTPTERRYPALFQSPQVPGALRAALRDYRPEGTVDIAVTVGPGAGTPINERLSAVVVAQDARCIYDKFPYAFRHVRGQVRLADGQVFLDGLTAQHGMGRIWADGVLENTHSWTGFSLTVRGRDIALNDELYAALPPEYATLWQSAAPLGLCDVVAEVTRAPGSRAQGPAEPEVRVDAHLLRGSLALGPERRLRDANGRLTVAKRVLQLHDLQGFLHGASVRVQGEVVLRDGASEADLRVTAANWPIVEDAPLKPLGGERVRLTGVADVWGRVSGPLEADQQQERYAVQLKEGTFHVLDPDRGWSIADGWLLMNDGEAEIVRFRATQDGAEFGATGRLPSRQATNQPFDLTLWAQGAGLEEWLPQFVPQSWQKLIEALGLQGTGDVRVYLSPRESDPNTQQARIVVAAERMRSAPFPLLLHDVQGEVLLAPGHFQIDATEANWQQGARIAVAGDGQWEGEAIELDLDVTARNLTFGEELNDGLPAPLAKLLARLEVTGRFDALMNRVRVRGAAGEWAWDLAGHMPLRDATLRVGLPVTELVGELAGGCTISAATDVDLDATFDVALARIADRPVDSLRGALRWQSGRRWVRLENLEGRLCGGGMIGAVGVDPNTNQYEVELTLDDVVAHDLMPPKDPNAPRRRGRIDGRFYVRGQGKDPATRRGGGRLRLRGASFLQTPVLADVKAATAEPDKISDELNQADIRFLWEGQLIRFERVEIQSKDLRFIGHGWWNLKTDQIEMNLVAAHPRHWPRLLLLTDAIVSLGQEVIQYRVEGTLAKPKVSALPLRRLSDELRTIIREDRP
jgi:hypothetical protein